MNKEEKNILTKEIEKEVKSFFSSLNRVNVDKSIADKIEDLAGILDTMRYDIINRSTAHTVVGNAIDKETLKKLEDASSNMTECELIESLTNYFTDAGELIYIYEEMDLKDTLRDLKKAKSFLVKAAKETLKISLYISAVNNLIDNSIIQVEKSKK